jgi:hypothetical protein
MPSFIKGCFTMVQIQSVTKNRHMHQKYAQNLEKSHDIRAFAPSSNKKVAPLTDLNI